MRSLLVAVGPRKLVFGVIVYVVTCYVAYNAYVSRTGLRPRLASLLDSLFVAPAHATKTTIAIGCAITSKRLRAVNESNIAEKFTFLSSLLPSFCRTASPQFSYAFYLAYDYTDRVFSSDQLSTAFVASFRRQIGQLCPPGIAPTLRLVNCSYGPGSPAWAQNDAMMDAYLDDADYFYRINDDTLMVTSDWAASFVAALERYDPPRVGVVGPDHVGGNRRILAYDFVHRRHVDAFGFYYPRVFTDWFGDGWITRVYGPDRCAKLHRVRVRHTLSLGRRYRVNHAARRLLKPTVQRDKLVLSR